MKSQLLEILKTDSSRLIVEQATTIVMQDTVLFDYVVDMCFCQPYPISMRAARVVQFCCEENPHLIIPRLEELIPMALDSKIDGVKRSFIKIIAEVIDIKEIPNLGIVFGKCFDMFLAHKEAIAIRVYCMEFVYKVSLLEPDLQPELIEVLKKELLDCSKGFRSRAEKIINKLEKNNNRFKSSGE